MEKLQNARLVVCISYQCILYVCLEGEDAEANWLYSSDPQMSANASHVHYMCPCSHVTICPSCGGHQHPTYPNPPIYTHGSAAGSAKPLPVAAAEKDAPAKPGPASVDQQKLPVQEEILPAAEDNSTSEAAASCVTSNLDYYVFEYVMKDQKNRVKDIEQQFGVTIQSIVRVCDEIVTVAFRRYNPSIQAENEEKARRAFLALYEVVYQRIIQKTVQVKALTAQQLMSSISSVYKEEVFVSVNPDGLFTLVGPFELVSVVEAFLRKQNASHNMGHPHAHDRGKFRQDDEAEEFQKETDGVGDAEGEPRDSVSVFEVGGRLTVKVYSADITRSSLDVIVNAANEHLQNYAGVAGAIEKAGGDELRHDCEAVVEKGGPLKV